MKQQHSNIKTLKLNIKDHETNDKYATCINKGDGNNQWNISISIRTETKYKKSRIVFRISCHGKKCKAFYEISGRGMKITQDEREKILKEIKLWINDADTHAEFAKYILRWIVNNKFFFPYCEYLFDGEETKNEMKILQRNKHLDLFYGWRP